jgi:hypothetical protein
MQPGPNMIYGSNKREEITIDHHKDQACGFVENSRKSSVHLGLNLHNPGGKLGG